MESFKNIDKEIKSEEYHSFMEYTPKISSRKCKNKMQYIQEKIRKTSSSEYETLKQGIRPPRKNYISVRVEKGEPEVFYDKESPKKLPPLKPICITPLMLENYNKNKDFGPDIANSPNVEISMSEKYSISKRNFEAPTTISGRIDHRIIKNSVLEPNNKKLKITSLKNVDNQEKDYSDCLNFIKLSPHVKDNYFKTIGSKQKIEKSPYKKRKLPPLRSIYDNKNKNIIDPKLPQIQNTEYNRFSCIGLNQHEPVVTENLEIDSECSIYDNKQKNIMDPKVPQIQNTEYDIFDIKGLTKQEPVDTENFEIDSKQNVNITETYCDEEVKDICIKMEPIESTEFAEELQNICLKMEPIDTAENLETPRDSFGKLRTELDFNLDKFNDTIDSINKEINKIVGVKSKNSKNKNKFRKGKKSSANKTFENKSNEEFQMSGQMVWKVQNVKEENVCDMGGVPRIKLKLQVPMVKIPRHIVAMQRYSVHSMDADINAGIDISGSMDTGNACQNMSPALPSASLDPEKPIPALTPASIDPEIPKPALTQASKDLGMSFTRAASASPPASSEIGMPFTRAATALTPASIDLGMPFTRAASASPPASSEIGMPFTRAATALTPASIDLEMPFSRAASASPPASRELGMIFKRAASASPPASRELESVNIRTNKVSQRLKERRDVDSSCLKTKKVEDVKIVEYPPHLARQHTTRGQSPLGQCGEQMDLYTLSHSSLNSTGQDLTSDTINLKCQKIMKALNKIAKVRNQIQTYVGMDPKIEFLESEMLNLSLEDSQPIENIILKDLQKVRKLIALQNEKSCRANQNILRSKEKLNCQMTMMADKLEFLKSVESEKQDSILRNLLSTANKNTSSNFLDCEVQDKGNEVISSAPLENKKMPPLLPICKPANKNIIKNRNSRKIHSLISYTEESNKVQNNNPKHPNEYKRHLSKIALEDLPNTTFSNTVNDTYSFTNTNKKSLKSVVSPKSNTPKSDYFSERKKPVNIRFVPIESLKQCELSESNDSTISEVQNHNPIHQKEYTSHLRPIELNKSTDTNFSKTVNGSFPISKKKSPNSMVCPSYTSTKSDHIFERRKAVDIRIVPVESLKQCEVSRTNHGSISEKCSNTNILINGNYVSAQNMDVKSYTKEANKVRHHNPIYQNEYTSHLTQIELDKSTNSIISNSVNDSYSFTSSKKKIHNSVVYPSNTAPKSNYISEGRNSVDIRIVPVKSQKQCEVSKTNYCAISENSSDTNNLIHGDYVSARNMDVISYTKESNKELYHNPIYQNDYTSHFGQIELDKSTNTIFENTNNGSYSFTNTKKKSPNSEMCPNSTPTKSDHISEKGKAVNIRFIPIETLKQCEVSKTNKSTISEVQNFNQIHQNEYTSHLNQIELDKTTNTNFSKTVNGSYLITNSKKKSHNSVVCPSYTAPKSDHISERRKAVDIRIVPVKSLKQCEISRTNHGSISENSSNTNNLINGDYVSSPNMDVFSYTKESNKVLNHNPIYQNEYIRHLSQNGAYSFTNRNKKSHNYEVCPNPTTRKSDHISKRGKAVNIRIVPADSLKHFEISQTNPSSISENSPNTNNLTIGDNVSTPKNNYSKISSPLKLSSAEKCFLSEKVLNNCPVCKANLNFTLNMDTQMMNAVCCVCHLRIIVPGPEHGNKSDDVVVQKQPSPKAAKKCTSKLKITSPVKSNAKKDVPKTKKKKVDVAAQKINLQQQKEKIVKQAADLNVPLLTAEVHDEIFKKIRAKIKHRTRGPNIWEYLVRLLINPATNPSLIGWEHKHTYTFRLMNPHLITDLWNARTEDKMVSYKHFARALRYWYKRGGLEIVKERQLIYKLGPLARKYMSELLENSSND
ncbi:unnamed protein product [Meganyctiphanes norvegica]|uniref:ETS domain-containing protein n=1 Tax=Meganyctiphanes norvegica TaxID=48144 RepID=A0AAV2SMU6_MEGNR